MDYTLVCGVDEKHLRQLAVVWPTWRKHKPSLLEHPMVVFFDRYQVANEQIVEVCDHPNLRTVMWPPDGVSYSGGTHKWLDPDPQRKKMLAGFVYVPPFYVHTDYWLKLDTDTIATGCNRWIDQKWFDNDPAIVAQKWGFTKPANQMDTLDNWAYCANTSATIQMQLVENPPLGLIPKTDNASRLSHKRIISWCGFFRTDFTWLCSTMAEESCGRGQLPVPSQDGYMWYCAKRMGEEVNRINVKSLGWVHRSTTKGIEQEVAKAMA